MIITIIYPILNNIINLNGAIFLRPLFLMNFLQKHDNYYRIVGNRDGVDSVELLKKRIIKDGDIKEGNIIKVDNFLNHQIDVSLLNEIGKEFKERFGREKIDKILTVEASGIAIAVIAAQHFNVPVVFAKKTESKNLDRDTYESEVYSYTKGKTYTIRVSKRYLSEGENILILDDFLAKGKAAEGLIDILNQAKCKLSGVGIVIEKGFQDGGENLRNKGVKLESLAIIQTIDNGEIVFK